MAAPEKASDKTIARFITSKGDILADSNLP